MKITVISEEMVSTSSWSGGISKQYYIYPPESSYAARDFKFRLSMATSSAEEEAAYSHLENITRHLVMLEGTAHVFHKGLAVAHAAHAGHFAGADAPVAHGTDPTVGLELFAGGIPQFFHIHGCTLCNNVSGKENFSHNAG